MTNPFVAEIRIFSGNFAPTGWALCNGQLLPLSQNTALFSLLGTTYGGDGKSNFALPNLQGSVPLQQGQGPGLPLYDLGEIGGSQNVTLLQSEMPGHNHNLQATQTLGATASPSGAVFGEGQWDNGQGSTGPLNQYTATNTPNTTLAPQTIAPSGGGLPHNNMMPSLGLTFIIALQGVFPPRP
jgi:microcystin-dependent protein